jgi:hypothetical protein
MIVCTDIKELDITPKEEKHLYYKREYLLLRHFFLKLFADAPEEIRSKEKDIFKKVQTLLNSLDDRKLKLVKTDSIKEIRELFSETVNPHLYHPEAKVEINESGNFLFSFSFYEERKSLIITSAKDLFFYCVFSGAPVELVAPFYFLDNFKKEFLNPQTDLINNLKIKIEDLLSFLLFLALPAPTHQSSYSPRKEFLQLIIKRLLTNEELEIEKLIWCPCFEKQEIFHHDKKLTIPSYIIPFCPLAARFLTLIGSAFDYPFISSNLFEQYFAEHWKTYDFCKKTVLSFIYIGCRDLEKDTKWLNRVYKIIRYSIRKYPEILEIIFDASGLVPSLHPGTITGDKIICNSSSLPLYYRNSFSFESRLLTGKKIIL